VLLASPPLGASGQAGIYGIVERVVFEPDAQAPERVQVWGAFALIERLIQRMMSAYDGPNATTVGGQFFTNYVFAQPKRGYMYFKLPTEPVAQLVGDDDICIGHTNRCERCDESAPQELGHHVVLSGRAEQGRSRGHG
jgi:hypothetical protein